MYKTSPAAKSFDNHSREKKLRKRMTFIMQFPSLPGRNENMMKILVQEHHQGWSCLLSIVFFFLCRVNPVDVESLD